MADYLSFSDLTLLERCRADDEKAWNTLFERYLPMAQKLASRVRHEYLEGQDLVAEGMIGLLSAVDRYRDTEGTSFSTFAYACMQNRMRNALRSVQAKGQIPPSKRISIEESYFQPEPSSGEETLLSEQEAKRIGEIVDTALSERERDVFLAFVHGDSYSGISARTGLSRKGVDAALQRARKKLREQLS